MDSAARLRALERAVGDLQREMVGYEPPEGADFRDGVPCEHDWRRLRRVTLNAAEDAAYQCRLCGAVKKSGRLVIPGPAEKLNGG